MSDDYYERCSREDYLNRRIWQLNALQKLAFEKLEMIKERSSRHMGLDHEDLKLFNKIEIQMDAWNSEEDLLREIGRP